MNTSKRRQYLRALRQEKRAEIADTFDKKYVSHAVARLWVIFGGDIALYQKDELKGAQRPNRVLRAIRSHNKRREEAAQLAKLRTQTN